MSVAMHARITPLLLVIGLLSSCNENMGISANDDQKTTVTSEAQLSFDVVALKFRGGGAQCPAEETEATAEADNSLCALVKLTYPKASSDVNPELAGKLNAIILQQMVDSVDREEGAGAPVSLEQFAEDFIADYKADPNPFTSWELERTLSVAFDNGKLLTLSFDEYGYTGGAHPFNGQRYSVFNLSDGEPVVLADLLNTGYETALNVTGEKAFRAARGLGDADSLEEQGFSFENNVFHLNENFGALKEGLEFVFNSYEIAPYAMGSTAFTIPYDDVHSLIRPDGLLSNVAQ